MTVVSITTTAASNGTISLSLYLRNGSALVYVNDPGVQIWSNYPDLRVCRPEAVLPDRPGDGLARLRRALGTHRPPIAQHRMEPRTATSEDRRKGRSRRGRLAQRRGGAAS